MYNTLKHNKFLQNHVKRMMMKVVINWDWAPHLPALFAKLMDKRMYMPLVRLVKVCLKANDKVDIRNTTYFLMS